MAASRCRRTSDTDRITSSAITTAPRPQHELALSANGRKAPEAVASGVRQAKTDNTRRAYDQAWGGITPGPRPGTTGTSRRRHKPWPSTSATWQRPAGPWPASSWPAPRFPTSTLPPACRRLRHPARPTSSPPTSSTGSARSCASPGAAAGAGQPQLAVMPRPRQAGALLCGRRVGVCNADPFPLCSFPLFLGLRPAAAAPDGGAGRTLIPEKN